MNQDLFEAAAQRRDQGIEQSSENSGEEWKLYAIEYVKQFLMSHQTLFVDDLWEDGLKQPSSPRALGAVMQFAVKEGWMVEQKHDGCILAKPSKASNMQLKRVWKSTLTQTIQ